MAHTCIKLQKKKGLQLSTRATTEEEKNEQRTTKSRKGEKTQSENTTGADIVWNTKLKPDNTGGWGSADTKSYVYSRSHNLRLIMSENNKKRV